MSYVPDSTGNYTITIKYGGDEIPYSPYRIKSLPTGDASKCLLTGESREVEFGFNFIGKKGKNPVETVVSRPSEACVDGDKYIVVTRMQT